MRILEWFKRKWAERKWTGAKKQASQWKRDALKSIKDLAKADKKLNENMEIFNAAHIKAIVELEVLQTELERRFRDAVNDQLTRLTNLKNEHESALSDVELKLGEAQAVIDKYDHTEEILNNELQIYRDVIVPQLTLSAEIGRQQMEAEIALQVQRQVFYAGDKKQEQ